MQNRKVVINCHLHLVLLYFRRREHVKELSGVRRNKLGDALLYAQFNRDVAEVGSPLHT